MVVSVRIKGLEPGLLMHVFPMVAPAKPIQMMTREEAAEFAAYRSPDGNELYVPGVNLQASLVSAARYSKGKRGASLKSLAAACLRVEPARLLLGTDRYEIDSRGVVIKGMGRVIRHRPWFPEWELSFSVETDDTLLREEQVREIVDNAGKRVGLLDFRPEKGGPFGRFLVTQWESSE